MKKIFLLPILQLLLCSAFSQVKVGILRGMDSVPFAFLYENAQESEYEFELFSNPSELFEKMQMGEIHGTVCSSLSAEKLVDRTDGAISVAACVSTTNFYIVGKESFRRNFSHIVGNKVGVAGNGLGALMLSHILTKNDIPIEEGPGGIELCIKNSQSELANEFLTGKLRYALLSEPATSVVCGDNASNCKLIDLQEQFQIIYGGEKTVPLSVLVVRSDFMKLQPKLFQKFRQDLEDSVDQVVLKPMTAANIVEKNGFGINSLVCASAIMHSNYDFRPVKGKFHLIVNQ